MFQLIDLICKHVRASDWAVVVIVRLTPVPIISTPKIQDMEKHVSRLRSFLCACCPPVTSVVRETYRSWKQRSDDICKILIIKRMSEVVKLQLSVCSLYRFLMQINCGFADTSCLLHVRSLINSLLDIRSSSPRLDEQRRCVKGSQQNALITVGRSMVEKNSNNRHELEWSPEMMVEDEKMGGMTFFFLAFGRQRGRVMTFLSYHYSRFEHLVETPW
jgi:hypothetical protein